MDKFNNIAVYGGGSFGTALASQASRCCNNTYLFVRNSKIAEEINLKKTNNKYLGNTPLPTNLVASIILRDIKKFELIIIAVPSRAFQETIELLKILKLSSKNTLLIATKGLAQNPIELLSDRLSALLPECQYAFIGGPNFAKEIALNMLSSATIASLNLDLATKIANTLTSKFFKIDISNDIVTQQIAGFVKNIIAIKSGFDTARGMGENAKAFLIVQALKEIEILSKALKGKPNNGNMLLCSSVLGDLVLTCYSATSRNTKFGYELGKVSDQAKFLQEYSGTVEGLEAIKLIMDFIKKYDLSLPLISSLAAQLNF